MNPFTFSWASEKITIEKAKKIVIELLSGLVALWHQRFKMLLNMHKKMVIQIQK